MSYHVWPKRHNYLHSVHISMRSLAPLLRFRVQSFVSRGFIQSTRFLTLRKRAPGPAHFFSTKPNICGVNLERNTVTFLTLMIQSFVPLSNYHLFVSVYSETIVSRSFPSISQFTCYDNFRSLDWRNKAFVGRPLILY